jgi:D-xylose transport system permease protein
MAAARLRRQRNNNGAVRIVDWEVIGMSIQTSSNSPAMSEEGAFTRFLRATEIDTRMLGMIAALILIWVGFDIYSGMLRQGEGLFGGSFLTPRNLWILMVQTSTIAVMTTGMVLVIVMRQIDLSVGSMLSIVAVATGVLQVYNLGPMLGLGHPSIWIIAVVFAIALGAAIGCFNGVLIAYGQIPSFIVTLGGLIAFSGAAFLIASGVTIAPMDKTFKIIGGNGPSASIGPFWSWVLGAAVCIVIVLAIMNGRRQRIRFKFPLRPIWAECFLAFMGSVLVLGATALVNAYLWPPKVAEQYALANSVAIPPGFEDNNGLAICMAGDKVVRCIEGLSYQTGYPIPVLIALAIGVVMTFISTRTRFGRYIFATGGSRRTCRHQHEAPDGDGLHADGRAGRCFGRHCIGASRCSHHGAGHPQRTLCDCRGRNWRHVPGGRHRHDLWRDIGSAADAVAAIRHGAAELRFRLHQYRRGRCPGPRRLC